MRARRRTAFVLSWLLALGVLMVGALSPAAQRAAAVVPVPTLVPADAETAPVATSGDSADDPAIWAHPTDPAQSLLIGNNKLGALEVYNLDGTLHQRITSATTFWGNVDVRQAVSVAGQTRDVIAAYNAGLRLYAVDVPTRELRSVMDGAGVLTTGGGEGICLYSSAISNVVSAFVIQITGRVRQFALGDADADGLLEGTQVRDFQVGSEAEGCVADDDTGALYISEEDGGLWRYGAEPSSGTARTLVDSVQPTGHLAADVEGVTLVDLPGTAGYVIVSAQNVVDPSHSYFAVYTRQTNTYVGAFRIVDGVAADGCSRTDGVTAYVGNLGPSYPNGVFVCQDDANLAPGSSGNQNFKLTRLESVVDLTPGGNQAPVASFVATCTQLTCSFDASGSDDPDGDIVSYAWDFGDGVGGAGQSPSHTYATPGTRQVTLTVTDDDGASTITSRQVSPSTQSSAITYVDAASSNGNRTNHPVRIPTSVASGDALVLVFTGNTASTITGPAGWTVIETANNSAILGRVWTRTATAADAGSMVTVTSSGLVKSDLSVAAYRGTAANPIMVSAAGLDTVIRGTHTTPTVTVTQGGGWLLSYWADKSADGTTLNTPAGQNRRTSSTGTGGGHVTAVLTDSAAAVPTGAAGGLSATGTPNASRAVMFTIVLAPSAATPPVNQDPQAAFAVSCVDLTCSFDASDSSDSDGEIGGYAWDFGDEAAGDGVTVAHSYAAAGGYAVTLTVTDDGGASDSITLQANPTDPPPAPVGITFVTAASTNGNRLAHKVTIPDAVLPGDALVLILTANSNAPTITGPAGWTLTQSVTVNGIAGRLWTRMAVAGDAGSTTQVTTSAYVKSDLTVAAYRATAASPVLVSAVGSDLVARTSHTTPVVSTAQSGLVLSYWADKSAGNTGLTTPAGQLVRASSTGTGAGRVTAALTDSASLAAAGTVGGLTATTATAGSRAVMFTVVLRPGG